MQALSGHLPPPRRAVAVTLRGHTGGVLDRRQLDRQAALVGRDPRGAEVQGGASGASGHREVVHVVAEDLLTLTVEAINADRSAFAQKMTDEAAVDLRKMGVNIDILTIQQISDEQGYLDKYSIAESIEDKTTLKLRYTHAPNEISLPNEILEEEFLALTEAEGVTPPVKAPLHDAARALQFVRSQAREWNLDKARIGATVKELIPFYAVAIALLLGFAYLPWLIIR